MSRYRQMIAIEADPDAVFRLLADVEAWPRLLPHVRSLNGGTSASRRMTVVWRWVPFAVRIASHSAPGHRLLEQRLGGSFGVRATCQWAVGEGPGGMSLVRLDAGVVHAPPLIGAAIAGWILRDLCSSTLAMVRLLAESDRLAHTDIT